MRACYVKGRLQPTYAFGDLHLKYSEFNNPKNYDRKAGYSRNIKNFKGGYINHIPVINTFKLDQNIKGILLGTDGLWDYLDEQEVL